MHEAIDITMNMPKKKTPRLHRGPVLIGICGVKGISLYPIGNINLYKRPLKVLGLGYLLELG